MSDGPANYDRRATSGALGDFGRYLMETAFDEAIRGTERALNGSGASPGNQELHAHLSGLTNDERDAVRRLARNAAVAALHGLLHGLSHNRHIRLLFNDVDVAAESDGLHGDLFIWMRDLSEAPHDWEA